MQSKFMEMLKSQHLIGEMARITLAVGKGFSGEIYRYEVDDEVMIKEIVKKFVDEIYHGERNVDDFVLFNLTRGFEYSNDETLASKGTASGDVVLLIDLKKD